MKKALRRLLCWVLGCERQVHAVYPLDERADDCDADVRCIRCGRVRRYQGRADSWFLQNRAGMVLPVVPPRRVARMLTRAWAVKRAALQTLAARGRDIRGGEDTVP